MKLEKIRKIEVYNEKSLEKEIKNFLKNARGKKLEKRKNIEIFLKNLAQKNKVFNNNELKNQLLRVFFSQNDTNRKKLNLIEEFLKYENYIEVKEDNNTYKYKPTSKLVFLEYDKMLELIKTINLKISENIIKISKNIKISKSKNINLSNIYFASIPYQKIIQGIILIMNYQMNRIFEHYYDEIRKKFGLSLLISCNISLCPYCQRLYIHSIKEKSKKNNIEIKGADLDHFFPISKYPYLGCTLENLIPSCLFCNQRLKRDIDIFVDEEDIKEDDTIEDIKNKIIPNPLYEKDEIFSKFNMKLHSFKIIVDFPEKNKGTKKYLGLFRPNYTYSKHSKIAKEIIERLKKYNFKVIVDFPEENKRVKKYLEIFRLNYIYPRHTEIIDEIIEKLKRYNRFRKKEIIELLKKQNITEEDIEDLVFYEYKNINREKTPLWKLKEDLFKELKGANPNE